MFEAGLAHQVQLVKVGIQPQQFLHDIYLPLSDGHMERSPSLGVYLVFQGRKLTQHLLHKVDVPRTYRLHQRSIVFFAFLTEFNLKPESEFCFE